jgi:hypothetical protein
MSDFFNAMLCEMCTDIAEEPAASIIRLDSLILMMEAEGCSETSGYIYQTTRHHIPEDSWKLCMSVRL